jgi:hypothetical protein
MSAIVGTVDAPFATLAGLAGREAAFFPPQGLLPLVCEHPNIADTRARICLQRAGQKIWN